MKKFLTTLLSVLCIVAMLFAFVACDGVLPNPNPDGGDNSGDKPSNTPATDPTAERIAAISGLNADVSALEFSASVTEGEITYDVMGAIALDEEEGTINADIYALSDEGATLVVIRADDIFGLEIDAEATKDTIKTVAAAYVAEHKSEFEYIGNVKEELMGIAGGGISPRDGEAEEPVSPDDEDWDWGDDEDWGDEPSAPGIFDILNMLDEATTAAIGNIGKALVTNVLKIVFNGYEKTASGCIISVDLNGLVENVWNAIYALAGVIDASADMTLNELYANDAFKKVAQAVLSDISGADVQAVLNFVAQIAGESFPIEVIAAAGTESALSYIGKYLDVAIIETPAEVKLGSLRVSAIIAMITGKEEVPAFKTLLDGVHDTIFGALEAITLTCELHLNETYAIQKAVVEISLPASFVASDAEAEALTVTASAEINVVSEVTLMDVSDCSAEIISISGSVLADYDMDWETWESHLYFVADGAESAEPVAFQDWDLSLDDDTVQHIVDDESRYITVYYLGQSFVSMYLNDEGEVCAYAGQIEIDGEYYALEYSKIAATIEEDLENGEIRYCVRFIADGEESEETDVLTLNVMISISSYNRPLVVVFDNLPEEGML